jgi:nitrate/TMAO reductase-like tetraheme cytochrome c subunit
VDEDRPHGGGRSYHAWGVPSGASTGEDARALNLDPLGLAALVSAAAGAAIIVVYLVRRPPLDLKVKLWLGMALGVLPGLTAVTSTTAGMQRTSTRQFCGSCHVMDAHFADASTPGSQSLAARHSRNPFFGDRSCYVCHADYGMFGYIMTKKAGLGHVYEYYIGGYKQKTLTEALNVITLNKPYDNANCRQCHTTTLRDWSRVPEHTALERELADNRVSCVSAGCHGYAHPFSKKDGARATGSAGVLAPGVPAAEALAPAIDGGSAR